VKRCDYCDDALTVRCRRCGQWPSATRSDLFEWRHGTETDHAYDPIHRYMDEYEGTVTVPCGLA